MKKRLKVGYEKFLKDQMPDFELDQRLQSYLGILSHANQYVLAQALKNAYWVRPPSPSTKDQKAKGLFPNAKEPRTNGLKELPQTANAHIRKNIVVAADVDAEARAQKASNNHLINIFRILY